jgi:hypothetical protein
VTPSNLVDRHLLFTRNVLVASSCKRLSYEGKVRGKMEETTRICAFSFCSRILNSVFLNMRFELHMALLLEIQVFWNVTLCYWLSSLGLLNPEDESTTTIRNTIQYPPQGTL